MKLFDFGVQRCACISSVARMPLEVSIMDALVRNYPNRGDAVPAPSHPPNVLVSAALHSLSLRSLNV